MSTHHEEAPNGRQTPQGFITPPETQLEFDLWGLGDQAADARIDEARTAEPSRTENALSSG